MNDYRLHLKKDLEHLRWSSPRRTTGSSWTAPSGGAFSSGWSSPPSIATPQSRGSAASSSGWEGLHLGLTSKQVAETFDGLSFAELEEFCLDVQHRSILDAPGENTKRIVTARLAQWARHFRVTK